MRLPLLRRNGPSQIFFFGHGPISLFLMNEVHRNESIKTSATLLLTKPNEVRSLLKQDGVKVDYHNSSSNRTHVLFELLGMTESKALATSLLPSRRLFPARPDHPIDMLLVDSNSPAFFHALSKFKHRLSPESAILLTGNDLRLYYHLRERDCFDSAKRPDIMLLNSDIQLETSESVPDFAVRLRRYGTVDLPRMDTVIDPDRGNKAQSVGALLNSLRACRLLGCQTISQQAILQNHLWKIGLESLMESACVLCSCRPCDVLDGGVNEAQAQAIAKEVSDVLQGLCVTDLPGGDALIRACKEQYHEYMGPSKAASRLQQGLPYLWERSLGFLMDRASCMNLDSPLIEMAAVKMKAIWDVKRREMADYDEDGASIFAEELAQDDAALRDILDTLPRN